MASHSTSPSTSDDAPVLEHPPLHEDRPGPALSGPMRPPAEEAPSLPPSRHSKGSNSTSETPGVLARHTTSAVHVFATARRTAHQESNSDAPLDGAREARVKTSARTSECLRCKLQGQALEDLLRLDLGTSHSPAMPPGPILFRYQTL
jgi:hypothetical protein